MDLNLFAEAPESAALLTNGIGAVLAHFDSERMHAAQTCGSVSAGHNCVVDEPAVVTDVLGGSEAFFIKLGSGDAILVDSGKVFHSTAPVAPGSGARVKVWNGRIVELTYDGEIVETTDNPDAYSQSWPVTLAFGLITALIGIIVYFVSAWATGYAPIQLGGRAGG
jgi:hypothetical protein